MVYYPIPQDQLPIYKGQYPVDPMSYLLATEVLSLPIWPEIKMETPMKIVNKASEFFELSS